MRKDKMWVISSKNKGIHLVDVGTPHPKLKGESFAMVITDEMARNKIPIKVPTSPFFMGHCKIGNIVQVEGPTKKVSQGRPKKEENVSEEEIE